MSTDFRARNCCTCVTVSIRSRLLLKSSIKKILIWLLICGSIGYFIHRKYFTSVAVYRKCYLSPSRTPEVITYFEDLLTAQKQPAPGNGIFFIESKCSYTGLADFRPRYACTIESAAKNHPQREIFVVYASPVGLPNNRTAWSPTVHTLLSYPNIHFRNVQLKPLSLNTPTEAWFETGEIFTSHFINEHLSDLIRLMILYKYGGTYLDIDMMLLRNISLIERNFAGIEMTRSINNAVLDFDALGLGHEIMHDFLIEFATNYTNNKWAFNGPELITRVMRKRCNVYDLLKMTREQCDGFHAFPQDRFYALCGYQWREYFEKNYLYSTLNRTKDAYGVHFWNNLSKNQPFYMRGGDAYDKFAKENCPKMYDRNLIF